jgi:hypothetical protein
MADGQDGADDYTVDRTTPAQLSEAEKLRCIELVQQGHAANAAVAAREIRLATALAVARKDGAIVAVGAIKRARDYTATVAENADYPLPVDTPEMGYVSVDKPHRDKRLSSKVIEKLLDGHKGPIFASTSSDKIRKINTRLGFTKAGREWDSVQNPGDKISLWVKDLKTEAKKE